ncbi:hypothetical protein SAMN04487943_11225 [Gracilibacillus orientalis]|uniref:Helix-turn-helix domain-containing protein n=1 Tax=Gracilibacillus orientalis TaxID=334253 RepID=A0A1I4PMC2_9BACI|nr:helix-turn-helix domain-containing protein [Gracilibacillus orientalis]SFM28613.1 hypothetical protein SAMN04487943_11225 [Gracilibacillus orientalis]
MLEINMKVDPDAIKKELYDLLYDVVSDITEDHKQENELPFLLSKRELAEHIFNVSAQSLNNHILHREDFPKIHVGERVLYPRDQVKEWIHKNIEVIEQQTTRLSIIK